MLQLKLRRVEKNLKSKGLKIFSARELSLFTGASLQAAQGFIKYHAKSGAIIKLKRNFYALESNLPSDFHIANKIYSPSYISLYSALSYHHLIPETVYSITSVTPNDTREYTIMNKTFSYRQIKSAVFSRYEPFRINQETVLIATPEKAIIDFLYYVSLGKTTYNDRLDINRTNIEELRKIAREYKSNKLLDLLNIKIQQHA